jgi:hypothetical protein
MAFKHVYERIFEMNKDQPITKAYFEKRFADLCLRSGLAGFPKDEVDQHILLKSAVLTFGEANTYTEKEINEKLEAWVLLVGQIKEIDRTTLRRRLVDTGYLARAKDGSSYQVVPSAPRPQFFAEEVDQVNVTEVIVAAREEIARRKKAYLEKSSGK